MTGMTQADVGQAALKMGESVFSGMALDYPRVQREVIEDRILHLKRAAQCQRVQRFAEPNTRRPQVLTRWYEFSFHHSRRTFESFFAKVGWKMERNGTGREILTLEMFF